jgi:putative transposase
MLFLFTPESPDCLVLLESIRFWVVQIDHTLVDVVIVDELKRLPLGRPWLTLAIDVASRMVTGFYLSLDAPSTLSVALALTQAVLPKDLWLCDRELELAWPACGRLSCGTSTMLPNSSRRRWSRGHASMGSSCSTFSPVGPALAGVSSRASAK